MRISPGAALALRDNLHQRLITVGDVPIQKMSSKLCGNFEISFPPGKIIGYWTIH